MNDLLVDELLSDVADPFAEGEADRADMEAAYEDVDPASNEYESVDPSSNEYPGAEGMFEMEAFEIDPSAAELDPELFEAVALGPSAERALILPQIAVGNRDENGLTNFVFWLRHPELKGQKLAKGQDRLIAEWIQIRDSIVRPALAQLGGAAPASSGTGTGKLGTLVADLPGRRFTYAFTPDDLLWTARFITGEAGGRDDAQNRAVLWAMFNRYAFFRDKVPSWGSFGSFLRKYSTPLQPYLKTYDQVKAHVAKCNPSFDSPGCNYQPTSTEVYPGTNVRKGQLKTFLALQRKSWAELSPTARSLAEQMLTGRIPNGIGNASEFADTAVYFRRKHGRTPTRAEWEQYTRDFARQKKWIWQERAPYDQYRNNVLFINGAARAFPPNATRVVPPGGAAAPAPAPAPASAPAPRGAPVTGDPDRQLLFDGKTPAPGTTESRRSHLTQPPIVGDPSNRNRMRYENVINQFAPGKNPRYAQKRDDGGRIKSTYCNIFMWDVTRAMGAEVPHWVDKSGNPAAVGKGNEMNANATYDWLHAHGARFGWRRIADQAEAQRLANAGYPVIVALKKPGGIGHLAVIRPGEITDKGAAMAQAGATNFTFGHFHDVFRKGSSAELWTHA